MNRQHFETQQPVDLQVEIGKGSVTVTCTETTESRIEVEGRDADQTRVEQHGSRIEVVGPRHRGGLFGFDSDLHVTAVVPIGSNVAAKTGSADVTVEGHAGSAAVKSGSGDVHLATVRASAVVETGSGDVRLDRAEGDVRVKSGSGDVALGHSDRTVVVSTGSGDVEIGTVMAEAVVKTGSGDLRVGEAHDDVSLSTGSGDFVVDHVHRGRLLAKGASGDVRVGIPAGLPVWTDITTVSGTIRSSLQGAGQPVEGQDHVELRAKTISGDVILTQL